MTMMMMDNCHQMITITMFINKFVLLETCHRHHSVNLIVMKRYPLSQTTLSLDNFLSILIKRKLIKFKYRHIRQVIMKINVVKGVSIVQG